MIFFLVIYRENILRVDNIEIGENHVYAKDVMGKPIHISVAASGRRGYFCLGCDKEMQAVISKIRNRASYFRHDAKAVENHLKCTYSDETYRHKLAKETLQLLKRLKVPPVYKFPPKGVEGSGIQLSPAKFIEAHHIGIEKSFYEDANGQILTGPNSGDDKFLLVKPDVTFFNSNNEPILFIEIVATHKVSVDKKVKLKRLGVDTVQITIPKGSPEEIEQTFFNSDRVKWIFNNEEQRTEYIRVSSGDSEGVLSTDELQRELFEESFACRTAQINNLLRSINRCLASKPYGEIESGFRSELSRVKANTTSDGERLRKLEKEHRENIERGFSDEFTDITTRRSQIEREQNGIGFRREDLGKRYQSKKQEIGRQKGVLEAAAEAEIKALGGEGKSIEQRKAEIRGEEFRIAEDFRLATAKIESDIEETERSIIEIGESANRLPSQFRELRERTEKQFRRKEDIEEAEGDRFSHQREGLPARLIREEEEYRDELQTEYRLAVDAFERRSTEGTSRLSTRIKGIFEAGRQINNYKEAQLAHKRNRVAWEFFGSETFKDWLKKK